MNPAQKRYTQRGLLVMGLYVVVLFVCVAVVRRAHPQGLVLYTLSLLPALPVFGFLAIAGRYLREERDEYQRELVVRCMLWGVAAMLASELFVGFLHTFGWQGHTLPFLNFYVFCASMIVAKLTYRVRDRVGQEPEDEGA